MLDISFEKRYTARTVSVTTEGENAGSWAIANENLSTLTSSNWSLTLADGGALKSTTANSSELRPNTNVGTAQGWSLAFTLTNNTSEAVTIIAPAIKEYCLDSTTNWNLAISLRAVGERNL